jgi:hypothetical protein
VLIFDEGQLTYEDTALWNSLFKPISANPNAFRNRIIIFTSYGNPTGPAASGTSMVIPNCQRITLCPVDHRDGITPIELFLTEMEFNGFITQKYLPSTVKPPIKHRVWWTLELCITIGYA